MKHTLFILSKTFQAIFCSAILSIFSVETSAQEVRGKVVDTYGEGMPFVNVFVLPSKDPVATTDFKGDYSVTLLPGKSTLEFSFVGYNTQQFQVEIKDKETIELNVILQEGEGILIKKGAEVIAKANRGSEGYLDSLAFKSGSTVSVVGNKEMSVRGDSKADDAVSRVSGVSSVGGIISVRGLNDRYVKTLLNGMELPTLDPFRNNVRLDAFPTGLIDNIIITKTMNPDLVGDWSGAYMSIQTKDYPSELVIQISSSVGYNTNATFNEIISSKDGSTDWLGYDDGTRGLPDGVTFDQEEFPSRYTAVSLNDQFEVLGLYPQLAQYGINQNTPLVFNSSNDIYAHIGLSELGYLGPGDFNNTDAVQNAINAYQTDNSQSNFRQILNKPLADIGQSFENTWVPTRETAPMNFTQSFTIGNTLKLGKKKKEFGFLLGGRYSRSSTYDPVSNTATTTFGVNAPDSIPTEFLANDSQFNQLISNETSGWNLLANLSYKLNKNNRISFIFMPNRSGRNQAREYDGARGTSDVAVYGFNQIYYERKQNLYQLETTHFLPSSKTQITFKGAYSDGRRDIEDFRLFEMQKDFNDQGVLIWDFPTTDAPNRRYIYMDEDLLEFHLDAELPILADRGKPTKLKFGASHSRNDRTTTQGFFRLENTGSINVFNDDELSSLEQSLVTENFAMDEEGRVGLYYSSAGTDLGEDIGFRNITAGYVSADYLYGKARLVGGLRVEHTDILSDIKSYYNDDIPSDDPLRINGSDTLNAAIIDQLDFLPSINLVYALSNKTNNKTNLRVNYSRSIARPGLRELVEVQRPNFELRNDIRGNQDLQITSVHNFDVKLEKYLKRGTSFAIAAFYKDFTNHIELVRLSDNLFTWQNVESSTAYGLELEGKKKLLRNLDGKANITLVQSQTTVTVPNPTSSKLEEINRPMFGQAPYVINAGFVYKLDSIGFVFSASYNVQGPKLALVRPAQTDRPDVFELPRNVIDLKMSKSIGEHFTASFSVRDLLNTPFVRAYRFEGNEYLVDFDRIQLGTTYNFGITYEL